VTCPLPQSSGRTVFVRPWVVPRHCGDEIPTMRLRVQVKSRSSIQIVQGTILAPHPQSLAICQSGQPAAIFLGTMFAFLAPLISLAHMVEWAVLTSFALVFATYFLRGLGLGIGLAFGAALGKYLLFT